MVMTVEERKAARKATVAKYYANNKAKMKVANDKWRDNNKESALVMDERYRVNNKERIAGWKAKYRVGNKDKVNALSAKYRAKKFGATIYMTKEDSAKIDELYTIANNATKLFGYVWEVDHILPLAKGGLHKLSNLQVVPMTWNRSKGDRNCDTYWD